MKRKWKLVAEAVVYFLLLVFVLPTLMEREVDAVWVIISMVIVLSITVVPEYLIARHKRTDTYTAKEKLWWKIGIAAFVFFLTAVSVFFLWMVFGSALVGEEVDATWVIICAILAPVAAVATVVLYLPARLKKRKRPDIQNSQRKQPRNN